jgi:glycosyltransferase involved in cell wall biosynthesis
MIPKNHEYIRLLTRHLETNGVSVVILKPFHYSTFSNIVKLFYYRARGYRLIHVHWLYIFPFGFVMRAVRLFWRALGIRVVWEMHNILPHRPRPRDVRQTRWFYDRSDAIIFHSTDDPRRAKELLHINEDKPHVVIPHGHFNESYPNTVTRRQARLALGLPADKKVVLCFGFIRANRGYQYLVQATRNMDGVVVLVAGKIMERDVYEELLEHEARSPNLRVMAGWIPDEDVQLYFNACDIVAVPYTRITTSGVIPLAYAFARPVISTNIGGIRDIVNDRTGILVPPRNTEALRTAITTLLSRDYQEMGAHAREFAHECFDWEVNARKVRELYETILQPCNWPRTVT